MQRYWRVAMRVLMVAIAAVGVLVPVGRTTAQTPLSGGTFTVPSVTNDETARLFSSPKGDVFRLSQTEAESRTGGGGLILAVARPQDVWQTLVEIRPSERGVSARDGELAIGPSGEAALVYRWWRHDPRSKQIRLARSDDGGKTWHQPTTSVDTAGKAFDPRVAWSKGKSLVVVWADERRGDRLFDIYARRSPDGGVTWEQEQVLSRFPKNGPTDIHARPQLLSDGGDRLWAVWVGVRGARSLLFLNRSLDGGRTWTDPVPLTGESRSVFGQILLRSAERMLLVWHDSLSGPDRIYAVSSSDGGAIWTAPRRVDHLSAGSPPATSVTAVLDPDGGALVAWHDARNGRDDIFLQHSVDGGRTWSKEDLRMDMDEPGTAMSRFPRLARSADGRVALVWEDDRVGYESVYARIRSAGQKPEWSPEVLVARPTGKVAARIPDVVWEPSGLYVVWQAWDHTLGPAGIGKGVAGRIVNLDKP